MLQLECTSAYNLLEGGFTVLVVNAQHIKNVPGRKTDVKDAEWIADLLRHGKRAREFYPPFTAKGLAGLNPSAHPAYPRASCRSQSPAKSFRVG